MKEQAAVVDQTKTTFGPGQGVALHNRGDVTGFGALFTQKFLARRGVEENLLDSDACADRHPRRARGDDLPALGANLRTGLAACMAAGEGQMADRGDAVERFAAKAKGGDAVEVVGCVQFAGGVAVQSQGEFVGGDAVAVVNHAQQTLAALANLHANLPRAGVQAVFDQFFGDVGRALYYLARGNFARHIRR